MPAGWPSSLQLPVDPSMFSDAAFHLAMEQVATGRFDEHGVPESVSVGEDDEEEVSSDGETFGVRASSMLNTTNATQAEGDRDGRSGAKNRKKKKKRAGVAEKIPTVSEERPATENGLEGSVRPLMAPARQNRQAHPPPAQTTQSQTPQTTTTTTNTPQAAHPPPPNVAAAAAAVATHPPSSRAAGKQPMNYAQQQQQQQQQPQPAPPPAARTAPAPPRQPSHHHNHGRHPSPPSSNASGHRPQPNAKSHGGTGGGTTNNKIWSTSSSEERERIKEFWLALGEQERRNLVKVEKEAVLKKMKEQQKHSCSCAVCGRKRFVFSLSSSHHHPKKFPLTILMPGPRFRHHPSIHSLILLLSDCCPPTLLALALAHSLCFSLSYLLCLSHLSPFRSESTKKLRSISQTRFQNKTQNS